MYWFVKRLEEILPLCREMKEKYGHKLQQIVALEEMAELGFSLCKLNRITDPNAMQYDEAREIELKKNIREEIVDVLMMLVQLTMYFGTDAAFEEILNDKINYINKMLEE